MWTEKKVVLASSNQNKLKEFEELFEQIAVAIIGQATLGIQSPLETGQTFIENALLKARHASNFSNLPVVSDDSGLVIPALNGNPGLYSARYSGNGASDQSNRTKLLRDMSEFEGVNRRGYYISAITLIRFPSDPDPLIAIGRWHGQILHSPMGSGGFGYDPIFLPDGKDQTVAQMKITEKNKMSHRALAFRHLLELFN